MRTLLLLCLALFLLHTPCAEAKETLRLDIGGFARIPVLHEGRIKPMASFAETELRRLSGGTSKQDPVAWLAETLFNPRYAAAQPVFAVTHPSLQTRLPAAAHESGLYSLEELTPFLTETQIQALKLVTANEPDITEAEKALVRLHENALGYGQIMQALSAFLPIGNKTPQSLGIEAETYGDKPTYLEISKKRLALLEQVEKITKSKGENVEDYTESEQALATLAFQFRLLQEAGARNVFFRIIPPAWNKSGAWLSPWALLESGQGGPQSKELMGAWKDMAKAYHLQDGENWRQAAARAREQAIELNGDDMLAARLDAEGFYSKTRPFLLAFLLYGLAGFLAAVFRFRPHNLVYGAAATAAAGGLAAHLAGIFLRIFILERPPVGSLYESLLFVSMVTMAAALAVEYKRRDILALAGGAAAALAVLLTAPITAPEGDDLEMLAAVLNTNFWLGTHVICITAGYGVSILAAVMAHIWLFRLKKDGLFKTVYVLSLAALLLTAVGTVLGGIWADQSWGRFWGWDPKENGALLIVLWLVWLLHGKAGGHLDKMRFCAGLALLNIVVALAWFGVNLLSTGLHSYGFTSGLATGLAAFCTAEALLTWLLYKRARRERRAAHEA